MRLGMVRYKCMTFHCTAKKVYYLLVYSHEDDDFLPRDLFSSVLVPAKKEALKLVATDLFVG